MGFSMGGLLGTNSSAKKAATVQYERTKEELQNQHQWEMADLEKAGLNPALTLGDSGAGVSAPSMANTGAPEGISGILNSAISAYTAKKQAETGDTQGQLNLAQAGKVIAETKGIPQQLKNDTIRALASQTGAQAQLKQAQITEALAPGQKKKTKAETSETKEREKLSKQGWLGKVAGTENYEKAKKFLPYLSASIPGLGIGLKGVSVAKKINTARKFGKGLWK